MTGSSDYALLRATFAITMEIDEANLSDVDLLRYVNQDNPDRLNPLIAEMDLDKVAQLCDELGRLRYRDHQDPNALINRVRFLDIKQRDGWNLAGEHAGYYEQDYYRPSIAAIRKVRAIVALQVDAALEQVPSLVTHEDYLRYFESFHPETLKELMRNLYALELTQGCNGPCRAVCGGGVQGKVSGHMPYQTVEWLSHNFRESIGEIMPILYDRSDITDYSDQGRNGADIIKLFRENTGNSPYTSISYRLDQKAINFLYDLVVTRKERIHRISRLVTGRGEEDLNRLLAALQRRAEKDGNTLNDDAIRHISNAFFEGSKLGVNTMRGNAIGINTPESVMPQEVAACSHGLILRAGSGFFGSVVRPVSRIFPSGAAIFPILPDQNGEIRFPQKLEVDRTVNLSSAGNVFVLGPRWTTMNQNSGQLVEKEERSPHEQASIDMRDYKLFYEQLLSFFYTYDVKTEASIRSVEDLRMKLTAIDHIEETDCATTLAKIRNGLTFLREGFTFIKEKATELSEKYADNKSMISEVNSFRRIFTHLMINELSGLKELLETLRDAIDRSIANNREEMTKETAAQFIVEIDAISSDLR